MKRVLLLLPAASYRNDDFLAAAKRLEVEVINVANYCHQLAPGWGMSPIQAVPFDQPVVALKQLLTALGMAFQVQGRLSDEAPVRAHGFDHTTQLAYAATAGAAATGVASRRARTSTRSPATGRPRSPRGSHPPPPRRSRSSWGRPAQHRDGRAFRPPRASLPRPACRGQPGGRPCPLFAGYRTVKVPVMPSCAWPGTGHRYW